MRITLEHINSFKDLYKYISGFNLYSQQDIKNFKDKCNDLLFEKTRRLENQELLYNSEDEKLWILGEEIKKYKDKPLEELTEEQQQKINNYHIRDCWQTTREIDIKYLREEVEKLEDLEKKLDNLYQAFNDLF